VLEFAAIEAIRDDGQVFSCDISPHGKSRKIFTTRQPVRLVAAITPFNHPLNQVVHKITPAIAAGAPMILKPSDKTPLTALKVAELLYEAGLPGWMLSVFVGPIDTVVTPLITDERVELVSFTGSVEVGKQIANAAGYKKLCLELGGNSPLIILDDADLDLAVHLAAEGAFRNSGQRCTAVKRLLVQEGILDAFTTKFVAKAATYLAGDPEDESTIVGTVIDEESAATLEARVLANVSRQSEIVVKESFGTLAPIIPIRDLAAAIAYNNSGPFALSTGIVTTNLDLAMRACKELQAGTTNVNEVPGYRLEMTPFGGLKDSGLGIKEGVSEAVKFMTNTKTFSLPW
jgi:aldehyde dehydrogenase (NAD+)